MTKAINREGHDKLWQWFGLSYASFAILPRVLMQEMPDEWQGEMAELLNEMGEAFPGHPGISFTVRATKNGKMVKMPDGMLNYRHPKYDILNSWKKGTL